MRNSLKTALLFLLLMGQAGFASASIIFDLLGDQGADVDGFNSASTTVDGLTATLTAFPDIFTDTDGIDRDLLLNQTSSNFGVNVEGLMNTFGCTAEDSDGIDDGCVEEGIIISFSEMVILESVSVHNFGSTDLGFVGFESGALDIDITHTGTTLVNQMVGGLGDQWAIGFISGNGFSFDSFTVSRVPEPSIIALFALGLFGIGFARRRRTHN